MTGHQWRGASRRAQRQTALEQRRGWIAQPGRTMFTVYGLGREEGGGMG